MSAKKKVEKVLYGINMSLLLFVSVYTAYHKFNSGILNTLAIALFLINMYLIKLNYKVHYKRTVRRVIFMFFGLMAMQLSFFALNAIGLYVVDQGRFIALIELGVYGVVGVLAYLFTTSYFRLPQKILNLDIMKLIKRFTS